ncbi:hypothetical protein FOMPIDRAFT_110597 [Fomitopsis schrenkii]|uniref:Uncharacterized protein n=1 Tax=Fomitopsis schrenkii TaxID=2126942 RepID=S8F929_FOMSC|nr:hypothetical protein FOMPIDRAFT_110597 [Fomitopsis schrenkii]
MMHTTKSQQSGSAKILSGSVSHVASRQESQQGTTTSEVSVQGRHQEEKTMSPVAREWMEHNKEEYFLYCDTNKDDKYTVPDPDPQVVQQASLNCIGKRIADWFRTYMRAESKNRRAKDPCWKGIYFSEIHLASLYTNDKDGWDWHAEIYVARWQPSEEPEA